MKELSSNGSALAVGLAPDPSENPSSTSEDNEQAPKANVLQRPHQRPRANAQRLCYGKRGAAGKRGGRDVDKPEQAYLTLHAIVEPASQTVLRVNQEPQIPLLSLAEFVSSKRQEGWEVVGIAPSSTLLLMILKRPLPSPQSQDVEG